MSGVPGGWCGYKEIEWLAFPKTIQWEGKVVSQDTASIASLLQQIGQFELEDNPDELKLYAYK